MDRLIDWLIDWLCAVLSLVVVPPSIGELTNLESLNLYNNYITVSYAAAGHCYWVFDWSWLILPCIFTGASDIAVGAAETANPQTRVHSISIFFYRGLSEIRIERTHYSLSHRLNRLDELPRGFGAFPVLEILDLTYNNLNERKLPGNFFMIGKSTFSLISLTSKSNNFPPRKLNYWSNYHRPSIDWLIDWLIDRLIDWLIDWLIDRSIDWLIDWLIGWLIDWLIDWIAHKIQKSLENGKMW